MENSDVIQGHFLEGVFHGPARSSSSAHCYGVKMFYWLKAWRCCWAHVGLLCNDEHCFVLSLTQRNAANARQDRSCNTTNGGVSSITLSNVFHRFGSAGTKLVSRVARAGRLSEAVLGWWEGGSWTSAGGKVHLLCIIQARLERDEHGIWICLPLPRPANSIVWRMGGRRTCFRFTCTTCRALPRSRSGGAQICNLWWQAGFEWKKIILGCFFSLKEWQLTAENQVSLGSHHALKQTLLKT